MQVIPFRSLVPRCLGFLFLLSPWCWACEKAASTEKSGSSRLDSSAVQSMAPVDSPAASLPSRDFELLEFDPLNLPESIHWKGKIVDGAHWIDREGEFILVISDFFRGMITDNDFISNLYANCFQKEGAYWKIYWGIKQFNPSTYESVNYREGTLEVLDLDGDERAESCFIYAIDQEGLDPEYPRLMLHVGGEKYTIRGTMPLDPDDYAWSKHYQMRRDPRFEKINPLFRKYAVAKWNAYKRDHFKRIGRNELQ